MTALFAPFRWLAAPAVRLEVFPLILRDTGVWVVEREQDAGSWQLPWQVAAQHPMEAVRQALIGEWGEVGAPRLLHGTSWRHEDGALILSFAAVMSEAVTFQLDGVNGSLRFVQPGDLAFGSATTAPAEIAVAQVLNHALRHLAFLLATDPAVQQELPHDGNTLAAWCPDVARETAVKDMAA